MENNPLWASDPQGLQALPAPAAPPPVGVPAPITPVPLGLPQAANDAVFKAAASRVVVSAFAKAGAGLALLCTPTSTSACDTIYTKPDHCRSDDDGLCRQAVADASRIYGELVTKRIPQYMYASRSGVADEGHYATILQKIVALKDALRRVRANCKTMPPDFDKWVRLANSSPQMRH